MAKTVRTKEQIQAALTAFFGSNSPNVLVQPGSGPQDSIDTYSEEGGRIFVYMTFLKLTRSVSGLRDLIADTTESQAFRAQLADALEMTDTEVSQLIDTVVEEFVGNEGLERVPATSSTLPLRFFTSSSLPGTIPLGTTARTPGLSAIEYATTIDILSQPVIPDAVTGLFYIEVPASATVPGASSRVPLNRVTQLSPPISGFTSVTNPAPSSGGTDRETNSALLDRYMNALKGRELDTYFGYDDFVRGQAGVQDVLVIANPDPLMVRGRGSELDIYVIADNDQPAIDDTVFHPSLMGTSLILNKQPVSRVTFLTVDSVVQSPGVDYNLVKDTGGFAGSNIGVDKIEFLTVPADGKLVHVEYLVNSEIGQIQGLFTLPKNNVPNSDVLVKEAPEILVDMILAVVKFSNYSVAQVQANVTASLETFFNALKLGNSVFVSDVVNVIENTEGVDRVGVPFNKMAPVGQVGSSDIIVLRNNYARLNSVSFL